MNQGIMSDRHIVADYGLGFLERTVDHGPVLHVHFIAHPDTVYIAADDGVEPNAAIITHDHISYNSGIWGQETVGTKLGEFAFYVEDQGHVLCFVKGSESRQ